MIKIGIGCKSGHHRSPSFAEKLYTELLNYNNEEDNEDKRHRFFIEKNIHLDIKTNDKIANTLYQRRNDDQFVCEVCNDLKCNDAKQMSEHLQSKKHDEHLQILREKKCRFN